MATPTLDVKKHAELREYIKQGVPMRTIARKLSISLGVVHKYSRLAPAIQSDKKRGSFHWREWVPAMQQMQELKRKSSYSQTHSVIELGDGTRPIALAGFSDQHLGAWGTDYNLLTSLTDEILNTPDLYIGMVGDYGQYAIKLRNVLEQADNLLPPEQQTDFIESWFDEIADKTAFATWGNHGVERQEKQAGESSEKRIFSRKVVWFNGIGHVDIKVGNQVYRGAVSHSFRGKSMLNPVHAGMRYMRFEGPDREFTMSGHTHEPGMEKYTDGAVTRVAINTGSIQTNSGFGQRYFSLTTHPVYPIIVFHPDRHEMTPFWSVKEWLAVRGK